MERDERQFIVVRQGAIWIRKPAEMVMDEVARLLHESGIEAPAGDAEISKGDGLRALFENARLQIETDTDTSRRIRLTEEDDQLVWTSNDEFVVTHHGIS
ncbi:MAG: hypothetical protein ACC655_07710, partial [Rhodothermia bacterium]